jgi:hypothetical protein
MNESTPNSDPTGRPMASPMNDIRKIRNNSGAAAKELRDFLAQMQGRNPREVLSAVSTSGLFRGVIAAFVWTLVIIGVFTAGPYVMGELKGDKKEQAAAAEGEGEKGKEEGKGTEAAKTVATDPAAAKGATTPAPPTADPAKAADPLAAGTPAEPGKAPTGAAATKAVDTLGIGETKTAPANVNPLEGAADDLLKGLK